MSSQSLRADDDILRRVRGEFIEMPGLRLTEAQAVRLWGLDPASCRKLLAVLVDAKFLFRTTSGAFMRVDHGRPLRAEPRGTTKKKTIAA